MKSFLKKGVLCGALLATLSLSTTARATLAVSELTLRQALDQAQSYSPDLKASGARESQAKSSVGIAESKYYPQIEAQAVDSSGFPGSSSYLDTGGLLGSPFRSGFGAGVVFTETLYDFGRTSNQVESLEHQAESRKQDTELTRYRVNQETIEAFFNCSLNRSQKETWKQLEHSADVVEHEVNQFVQTGQRSIVDRYLAETQKEEARTAVADYQTREEISKKRLAIIMGIPMGLPSSESFNCPLLPNQDGFGLTAPPATNPLIARAEADLKSVQSELAGAKSENLPNLVGMGSAGYLQDQRLVNRSDYSLGIGISIPLFEGFRIQDNVNRTAAQVQEKDYALQASRQLLDNLNEQYDETILSSESRLAHLGPELALANQAFDLAKKRYFEFQGDLLDVRTALTNLTRVLIDENTTRARYLQAKESKEVLNGAH
jgi:outer membrane protein TolC